MTVKTITNLFELKPTLDRDKINEKKRKMRKIKGDVYIRDKKRIDDSLNRYKFVVANTFISFLSNQIYGS